MRLMVLLLSATMLVFSLLTVLDYWRYDEVLRDVARLMRKDVKTAQIEA